MSFGDSINSTNTINTATMDSSNNNNNNNNNNRKRGTRRVSFNNMAELYLTQTASSSLSETDASALWWTSEDYKTNKRKNKILARRCRGISGAALSWNCDDSEHEHELKQKQEQQDDEYYHRGLESIMDGGRCRALAQRTVETVRKEQARHLLDGVDGEASGRFIARIYRRQSLPSKMRAERLGELDAIAARTALESDWEREPEHEPEDEHEHEHDSEAHKETPVCEDRDDAIASDHEKENNEAGNSNKPKAATKLFRRSPERGQFPTNFRISITNVIHRRRHAWI